MQQDHFKEKAAGWDQDYHRVQLARAVADEIAEVILQGKLDSAMEFGCGTGLVSMTMVQQIKNIVAIDISSAMLDELAAKLQDRNIDNIQIVQADLTGESAPPVPGSPFDAIYSSMTLHHVENLERTLQRFFALLNPGGRLAIADLDKEDGLFHRSTEGIFHLGFDQKEFADMLTRIGFVEVGSHVIYQMNKPCKDGVEREFDIFLIHGKKP